MTKKNIVDKFDEIFDEEDEGFNEEYEELDEELDKEFSNIVYQIKSIIEAQFTNHIKKYNYRDVSI